jgi:Domain of unknown function (DUF4266)
MLTTPEAASPLPLKGAPPAGRPSRIPGGRLVVALLVAAALGGCAMPQPWVKPYERERLADPIMRFNRDSLAAKHSEHVRDIREAARGATGVQGGGCGCK